MPRIRAGCVYRNPVTTVAGHRTGVQLAGAASLLAVVIAGLCLGPIGWLAGVAYGLGLVGLLGRAARGTVLGPADLVTLARAVLVGGVLALVVEGGTPALALVVIASVALVLDYVDGQVARRSGTASELGARFDMEVDAFLLLVLSVHVATLLGPWVLAMGLLRYTFVAASWVVPWLRGSLPVRSSAKVVAAASGIVLVVAAAQVLPAPVAASLVAACAAALGWSFAGSVVWLWRTRG